ncbi:MAG: ABC transporter permease [Chloroflexi bacterium]|nr:ABC transporter permease [Chloroflexota bacterium]
MQQYILRRSILNIFVLILVATMVFGALRIDSGSVVTQRAAGCFTQGDPEGIKRCKEIARLELGLDGSIAEQYWDFMWDLSPLDLRGWSVSVGWPDLGLSFREKEPVIDEIAARLPASAELGFLQIMVALLVAIPIGIISAIRQDSWVDYFLRFFSIAWLGIPVFVIAVFWVIAVGRWFEDVAFLGAIPLVPGTLIADWGSPVGAEYKDIWEDPIANLQAMAAPALLGGLATGAIIMRFLRSQMLEVLRQDYVRTAWSKGLKERVVVVRHALKNALIPVLTLVGILLGSVIAGNVILENIFRINGVGFFVTSAVAQAPDFPVVQGIVIIVAGGLVFVNLAVDIIYGWLDPRIRYG